MYLVCWTCPLVVCWEVRKAFWCHAWCKTKSCFELIGKKCIQHWAIVWRLAYLRLWQSLCGLARSASKFPCPSPGTLDFHRSRWISAEARPRWAQSTAGGGGSRLEMLLSTLHESNLGNIYGAEKTGLVYKMPAGSKLPLRDEEHTAACSVCC